MERLHKNRSPLAAVLLQYKHILCFEIRLEHRSQLTMIDSNLREFKARWEGSTVNLTLSNQGLVKLIVRQRGSTTECTEWCVSHDAFPNFPRLFIPSNFCSKIDFQKEMFWEEVCFDFFRNVARENHTIVQLEKTGKSTIARCLTYRTIVRPKAIVTCLWHIEMDVNERRYSRWERKRCPKQSRVKIQWAIE